MKSISFTLLLLLLQNILVAQFKHEPSSDKSNGDLLWYFFTDYWKCSDPISNQSGNIYFLGYKTAGVPASTLYFLSETGSLLDSVNLPERIEAQPMIIPQTGEFLLGSENSGKLYCLNPDGSINWIYDSGGSITQPAAIDTLGNIFFASENILYSLSPTGSYQWEYVSTQGHITSPLSISKNGNIYFGTEFSKLIGVQNWGDEIFVADLFDYVRGEPTIDIDGTIYMATSSVESGTSKIEAFSPDGNLAWDLTVYEPNSSAVIIGDSNYLYIRTINFFGGGYGRLYKIDKTTQSVVWDFYFGGTSGSASTPTVSSEGTCYFSTVGSTNGRFYAINSDGTIKWAFSPVANGLDCSPLGSMLLGNNGNVFTYGTNMEYDVCYLMALEEPDEQLAESPWPMFRHDNFRSGLGENLIIPAPQIILKPQMLDFGIVEPGTQLSDTLLISNLGVLPLTIDWELNSEVFLVEEIIYGSNTETEIIEPSDSILMVLSFSPIEAQLYEDTLLFITNDPIRPEINFILKGKSSNEGEIKWSIQLTNIACGPAIDDFGTIYITGWDNVWAITPEGEIKWGYEAIGSADYYDSENITISHDNRYIYFPKGKSILTLDSTGAEQWVFDPPANDWVTTLAISNSGKIFFNDMASFGGGYTYCLNNQGSEIWNHFTGLDYYYEPIIDKGGNTIVAGNMGNTGKILSINMAGSQNWQNGFFSTGPVSIGKDEIIYIGGMAGPLGSYYPCVRAYSKDGIVIWSTDLFNDYEEILTEIIVGPDEMLYFGVQDWYNDNGAFYKVDNNGNILWANYYDGAVFSTPAIAANGTVYFGCDNGNFYALNPDGSERWLIETNDCVSSSPAIDPNGNIYFTNEEGYLYAVYGENGGLANTPWPMKQHDTKHSSSVDTLTVNIRETNTLETETITITNHPNPLKHSTLITYFLPDEQFIACTIIDIHGDEYYKWGKTKQKKGYNHLSWNRSTNSGEQVIPGVYIFILKTSDRWYSRKIIVQQ